MATVKHLFGDSNDFALSEFSICFFSVIKHSLTKSRPHLNHTFH